MLRLDCRSEAEEFRDLRRVALQLHPTQEESGIPKDTTGFTPRGTSPSTYWRKRMGFQKDPTGFTPRGTSTSTLCS